MQVSGTPPSYILSGFVLIAVVSGPIVPGVDLTPETHSVDTARSALTTANSSLTVAQTTIPTTGYQLKPGVAGSGIHKFQPPPANLTPSTVSGSVLLTYTIRIPELGSQSSSIYTINSDLSRQLVLSVGETTIPSNRIKNESYSGTVEIAVRTNETKRIVANESVTIIVA